MVSCSMKAVGPKGKKVHVRRFYIKRGKLSRLREVHRRGTERGSDMLALCERLPTEKHAWRLNRVGPHVKDFAKPKRFITALDGPSGMLIVDLAF